MKNDSILIAEVRLVLRREAGARGGAVLRQRQHAGGARREPRGGLLREVPRLLLAAGVPLPPSRALARLAAPQMITVSIYFNS